MTVTKISNTQVTEPKFQPGDRVADDQGSGTLIDYRPHTKHKAVLPFVEWDNGQSGYSDDSRLRLTEDVADIATAVIDVTPIDAPGPRLTALNTEIIEGLSQVANGLHRVQAAAYEIQRDRLWIKHAESFEAYCEERFGWKKSNAYSMAKAGHVFGVLTDSGIPESDIPESTSALEQLGKVEPEQQADVLQATRAREGNVTVAGIKKTLQASPSIELMIALWSQLGNVRQPDRAGNPEHLIIEGDLFDQPLEFENILSAQAHWQREAQKLAAIARSRGIEPDPTHKATLRNVPCTIVSTARKSEEGQHAWIMGAWSEAKEDAAGNRPTAWEYPVMLNGSPILKSYHLYQLQIDWEDTFTWQPTAPATSIAGTAAAPAQAATVYQPREVSPLYQADDVRGQQKAAIAAGIPDLEPMPATKQYSLLAIDPPWKYDLREADKTHRNRTPYPNMTDEEIQLLPVGDMAADDSYVLLWATNNHLPLAFDCLMIWGFTYKTIHTWVKVSKAGKPRMGGGHYGRNCTEHFLVGRKGNPPSWLSLGLTDIPNVFMAERTETHSEKPPEFWAIANRLRSALGGPAIELFSRQNQEGWEAWGLEAE